MTAICVVRECVLSTQMPHIIYIQFRSNSTHIFNTSFRLCKQFWKFALFYHVISWSEIMENPNCRNPICYSAIDLWQLISIPAHTLFIWNVIEKTKSTNRIFLGFITNEKFFRANVFGWEKNRINGSRQYFMCTMYIIDFLREAFSSASPFLRNGKRKEWAWNINIKHICCTRQNTQTRCHTYAHTFSRAYTHTHSHRNTQWYAIRIWSLLYTNIHDDIYVDDTRGR